MPPTPPPLLPPPQSPQSPPSAPSWLQQPPPSPSLAPPQQRPLPQSPPQQPTPPTAPPASPSLAPHTPLNTHAALHPATIVLLVLAVCAAASVPLVLATLRSGPAHPGICCADAQQQSRTASYPCTHRRRRKLQLKAGLAMLGDPVPLPKLGPPPADLSKGRTAGAARPSVAPSGAPPSRGLRERAVAVGGWARSLAASARGSGPKENLVELARRPFGAQGGARAGEQAPPSPPRAAVVVAESVEQSVVAYTAKL